MNMKFKRVKNIRRLIPYFSPPHEDSQEMNLQAWLDPSDLVEVLSLSDEGASIALVMDLDVGGTA